MIIESQLLVRQLPVMTAYCRNSCLVREIEIMKKKCECSVKEGNKKK